MIKRKHTKAPMNNKTWQCRCGAVNEPNATECKRISTDKMRLIKSVEGGYWTKKSS